jgi:heat shock protein HslJ
MARNINVDRWSFASVGAAIVLGLLATQVAVPSTTTRQNRPLTTTYWRAIEIAGKPAPAQAANREAHLSFQPAGRVTGSDGCNKLSGTYTLTADTIAFGQVVSTQMACVDTADTDRAFQAALRSTTRWKIAGDRLELLDAAGKVLVAFQARPAPGPDLPAAAPKLVGTTWQLVKFQGGDGTALTPDDKSKYVIEFGATGQMTARIDCNRGRGTWKGTGASQLTLGPLALTRAKCPEGSLHDRIVKQWTSIRSFVIKDGHLFLSLMADGGIYEFEAIPRAKVSGRRDGQD